MGRKIKKVGFALHPENIYRGKAWNKGLTKDDSRVKKYIKEGKENGSYKGDLVTYSGLHYRIRKLKGKAQKCTLCGSIEKVEWANKSHTYQVDMDDYFELCNACHREYDRGKRTYEDFWDEKGHRKI